VSLTLSFIRLYETPYTLEYNHSQNSTIKSGSSTASEHGHRQCTGFWRQLQQAQHLAINIKFDQPGPSKIKVGTIYISDIYWIYNISDIFEFDRKKRFQSGL